MWLLEVFATSISFQMLIFDPAPGLLQSRPSFLGSEFPESVDLVSRLAHNLLKAGPRASGIHFNLLLGMDFMCKRLHLLETLFSIQ